MTPRFFWHGRPILPLRLGAQRLLPVWQSAAVCWLPCCGWSPAKCCISMDWGQESHGAFPGRSAVAMLMRMERKCATCQSFWRCYWHRWVKRSLSRNAERLTQYCVGCTDRSMSELVAGDQPTRMPGVAPGQGLSTWMPGWAFSSPWLAASTMPSLTPNFILRGARLATTTVSLPIRSSGW